MMNRICVWFQAFSKRLLKKRFFLFLLIIFPLMSLGVLIYSHSNAPLIQVALFNEGDTELAEQSIAALTEQNSVIHFYRTSSLQELYEDVEKTTAECGYVFTKDYTAQNLLEQRLWSHSVHAVESPGSMLTGSINELVFASFFQPYTKELLLDYIRQPGVLKPGQDTAQIAAEAADAYEEYCQAEGIFNIDGSSGFQTSKAQEQLLKQAEQLTDTFISNLCRGILSVLILLAAMSGALHLLEDRKGSLLLPLPLSLRPVIELLELLAPAALTGISGLLGLALLPAAQPLWKEAAGLLFYIPCAVLFTYILLNCIRSEALFRTLLPLLTLGALLFAPVFLDFSVYAKILTIPKYLFANSYYLQMATGGLQEFLLLAVLLAGLSLTAFVQTKRSLRRNSHSLVHLT